jgi:hypothetical protein
MSYFQYKVVDSKTSTASTPDAIETCLNQLGKDGWDLLGDTVRRDFQTDSFFAIVRKETVTKKETVYT